MCHRGWKVKLAQPATGASPRKRRSRHSAESPIGGLWLTHAWRRGNRPIARVALPTNCHRFLRATAAKITTDTSTVMSSAAYTRHLTETGPIIRMAEMPKTVTTRALKVCSPPSIAPADNAFDRGTARPNSDMRVPSPTTFPATPNCPIASDINCATKLRYQERPLISQVNACLQAHVLAN